MDYIYQSPINCPKGNLKCVLKCTKFSEKKANGYMFKTNCSSIEHRYKKLDACFNKKRGKNKCTCPIFDNKFLYSSKQLRLGPIYFIFPIKYEYICDYHTRYFMSSRLILDNLIMNLFSDIT